MINIENVSFKYKGSSEFALKDINLNIQKGEFVGIIGNSGAGKTSLTCVINGIIPHHYNGEFYGCANVNGLDTVDTVPEKISKYVGSVFQDVDAQMVASTVEDEVLFGLENFAIPKNEIEERINMAMKTVGILELRNRKLSTLSGGQKQKVAISSIVALRPEIIILDEPTGELDPQSSRQIFEMLKKLNKDYGITIIVVEQKIMLQCEFVKRLIVMYNGKIALDDNVREVIKKSQKLKYMGINVPRIVTLAEELKNRNMNISEYPLNVEEAGLMVKEVLEL